MKKGNNKGAAMVTVLIAITFVAILVSSMLYASYVNFLTKSTRVRSANNFYSDEFALDEIAASLQQTAAEASTVDEARQKIRLSAGVTGTTSGQYQAAALQSMINMAIQDPAITDISVNNCCADPAHSYTENGSEITFHDVELVARGANDFETRILTDIVLNMPQTKGKSVDINSFSVICDDQLYNVDDKAGNQIYNGNFYVSNKSGNPAVTVDYGRFLQCMGDFGVIDGNLLITGRSAMYIAGDFIVNGDIKIEENSSLLVGGHLWCLGLDVDSSSQCAAVDSNKNSGGVSHIDVGYIPFTMPDTSAGEKRMAEELLARHLYLDNGGGTPIDIVDEANGINVLTYFRGYTNSGCNYNTISGFSNTAVGYKMYQSDNPGVEVCTNSELEKYRGAMFADDAGGGMYISNGRYAMLNFLDRTIKIRNECPECTYISLGGVCVDQCHSLNISHLSDLGYQAVLDTLIKTQFDAHQDLGYINDGDSIYDALTKASSCWKYDELTGAINTDTVPTSIDVRSSTRYLLTGNVGGNNHNFVPYGYLLTSDTSTVISKHFPMITPSDTSVKPTVQFKHWTKE